ncbi:hypothetical protein QQS21_000261 [Conoideocrella luteorostrata]|uniref:Uncharacterized protein n=1 Tax=Conoideocrella luteorostrata TaxID=1105319 RepID=A0AAJ0G476_9HYPO|nr:hypothetical protein QQS21_000261 [Conoideocrella luteorostrata]
MHQLRMEWLSDQLNNATDELGGIANNNIIDPALSFASLTPVSNSDEQLRQPPRSSTQCIPAGQYIDSTQNVDHTVPPSHDLNAWTLNLPPTSELAGESSLESIEAFTTPMSFTHGNTYLGQLSDPTTPNTSYDFRSPKLPLDKTEIPCACIQTQATNISNLHQLNCREISSRFDVAMKSATSTLESCERFIACVACDKSYSSILLTVSAIELIFTLFEQLAVEHRGLVLREDKRLIPYSLGDYKVSEEEAQAIRNVLLKMTLSKGEKTLRALQNIVNDQVDLADESGQGKTPQQRANHGSERSFKCLNSADGDYITDYISRKGALLKSILETLVDQP